MSRKLQEGKELKFCCCSWRFDLLETDGRMMGGCGLVVLVLMLQEITAGGNPAIVKDANRSFRGVSASCLSRLGVRMI